MKLYGLIGEKLGHSFSKKYFTEKFEAEGIDAQYNLYELPSITEFPSLLANNEFEGLNVTIPYKEKITCYLDELDSIAKEVGAVNTIRFKQNGCRTKTKGYNTDVIGFSNSIKHLLKPQHKHALILGTGGASKAVAYSLYKMGIEYQFVSRSGDSEILTYQQVTKDVIDTHEVIINCTPVGMYPKIEVAPGIPYQYLTSKHLLFDLIYNPGETLFCKSGKEHGATVMNGLEMLHEQAAAAWSIWNK